MEIEILDFFHRPETSDLSFYILFNIPTITYSRKSIEKLLGEKLDKTLLLFSLLKFDEVDKIFQDIRLYIEEEPRYLVLYFDDENAHKIKSCGQILRHLSKNFFIYDDYSRSYYSTFLLPNSKPTLLASLTSDKEEALKSICPNIFKIGDVDSILRTIYTRLIDLDGSLIYKDKLDRDELFELLCFYLYYKNESTKSD